MKAMNIFRRRESAEQAAETALWEAQKRGEQVAANPADEIAKLRIELEEAQAYAESREKMRARWMDLYYRQLERYAKLHTRTDEAERQLAEAKARVWQRDGQVENQASQIVALETERDELKQSLDGTREQLRQAHIERARAEQAAAEAERLHRERRLA